jgi:nicotinamide phosphoribosyltransferase
MRKTLPTLLVDGYKVGHPFQYAPDTEEVYSNLTPRKGRDPESRGVVFFGLQYFCLEYLISQFEQNFFEESRDIVLRHYKRRMDAYLGPDSVSTKHIGELHEHGKLPVHIKALPEGTIVPYGVPMLTIRNTQKEFFWVTNMLETIMSNVLWKPITSATSAHRFRQVFDRYSRLTVSDDPNPFVDWQGHDFSFRGMSGLEDACLSGAAHLLSFTGTDTIPAIDFLENYYGADVEKELVGGSVAATEHSVMCMGSEAGERETYRRLIQDVYPAGNVSIVSDTWDFWKVLTETLPSLKEQILARKGKLVVRPDSGVPELIINGDPSAPEGSPAAKGAIRLLDEVFGHTLTPKGYKVLDSHVGLIYGDSINLERQETILGGLKANGYASDNVVLGMGSFNFQYVTRDTHSIAMKATFGRTTSGGDQAIFKAPKTDDGGKFSARGLLRVDRVEGKLVLRENVSREEELGGELKTVFLDGELTRFQTLAQVRGVLAAERSRA